MLIHCKLFELKLFANRDAVAARVHFQVPVKKEERKNCGDLTGVHEALFLITEMDPSTRIKKSDGIKIIPQTKKYLVAVQERL